MAGPGAVPVFDEEQVVCPEDSVGRTGSAAICSPTVWPTRMVISSTTNPVGPHSSDADASARSIPVRRSEHCAISRGPVDQCQHRWCAARHEMLGVATWPPRTSSTDAEQPRCSEATRSRTRCTPSVRRRSNRLRSEPPTRRLPDPGLASRDASSLARSRPGCAQHTGVPGLIRGPGLLRPHASGERPRPTVMVTNGSDGSTGGM